MTGSMIAVFERIDLALLQRILAACSAEDLPLVNFLNQSGAPSSVPDARISGSFNYLFEVKTEHDAIDVTQLRNHLDGLTGDHDHERLFVVTPDGSKPATLNALANDPRVAWFNFATIVESIDALLDDRFTVVSELERYLLRELQSLFWADGLITQEEVVVVPARLAYPIYLKYGVYTCQPGRSFRSGIRYVAFYADGEIKPEVARILSRTDTWQINQQGLSTILDHDYMVKKEQRREVDRIESLIHMVEEHVIADDEELGVFFLSGASEPDTIILNHPIVNDLTSADGRRTAWVQLQRYISLSAIQSGARTTTELESFDNDRATGRRPRTV